MEVQMRGVIKLIPVEKPVEGMKVVAPNYPLYGQYSDGALRKNVAGHMWDVDLGKRNPVPFAISELQQIAIEYEKEWLPKELLNEGETVHTVKATLPLISTDWEYALKHIGEEVEFENIRGKQIWKTDQQEWQEMGHWEKEEAFERVAKLTIPSPILYTEKEACSLAWSVFVKTSELWGVKYPNEEHFDPIWNTSKKHK